MTLTKDHIISSIGNRLGVSKFESSRLVESVLETIKTSLSNGEDVLISGFGKFSVRKKAPRKGRNPATGEDLPLGARTVVTSRCSTEMRDRINGKGRSPCCVFPATLYRGIGDWDRAAARERSWRLAQRVRKRPYVSKVVIHSASRVFERGDTIVGLDYRRGRGWGA